MSESEGEGGSSSEDEADVSQKERETIQIGGKAELAPNERSQVTAGWGQVAAR